MKAKAEKAKKGEKGKQPKDSLTQMQKVRETIDSATVSGLMRFIILTLAAVMGLVVTNIGLFMYIQKSKTEVIAITETGRIIRPVPLPEAFVTDSRVLSYVDTCLRDSFSHDFENYRKTVNAAMSCYTSAGGVEFKKELEKNLQIIRERRLIMSITLEPPTITHGPFIQYGRATWGVQTIITVFYQGAGERYRPQRYVADVTVVRVPLEESLTGISINSIQLRPTI